MNIDSQRNHLRRWLREYAVWRELEAVPPGPDAPANPPGQGDVDFSREPAPAWGQIRLWPAKNAFDPPFYALLNTQHYGGWDVLPVSPFSTAALPEELQVMEAPPLQVLQGWNLRRISAGQACHSWYAGQLPETERFRLSLFCAWIGSGEAVPLPLEGRVGPPRVHPLDPRHDYLEAEYVRADRALGPASRSGGQAVFPFSKAAEPEPGFED